MALSIGIVGLPNVGKSTLFNALTKEQNAEAANYPFCTIEPNKAIVAVPDQRADMIVDITGTERAIHATIEFVDVAGLVKGASKGEGLGNKFLGHIRDVDAILHVVRCFEDPNVVHVNEKPSPRDDVDVINMELALADLEQIERKIEKLEREVKGDKDLQPVLAMAERIRDYLGEGKPLWAFPEKDDDVFRKLNHEMRFLTGKPVLYAGNVAEDSIDEEGEYFLEAKAIAEEQGAEILKISARIEAEIAGLPEDERKEYMELIGMEESGLERVIQKCYAMLGLISYFTFNDKEVHTWTIQKGWRAPKAAGVIHSDFERGFIRAEVIPYQAFELHKSRAAVRDAGDMRVEGKDYQVTDGDIITFRTNV